MNEISLLISTLKRLLKKNEMTYQDVARSLGLSEACVKRMFASKRITLERLLQICELLDFTLAELVQESSSEKTRVKVLTTSQESQLVADIKLLLVAVCTLNHWTLQDIVKNYQLTEAECVQKLVVLDRLRLLDLLPGNRIRLVVSRDFDWLADGPIQTFFKTEGQNNFMDSSFSNEGESMTFIHGMFNEISFSKLKPELRRLKQIFSELHEESLFDPIDHRTSASMLLAVRKGWEPIEFKNLRRST